ncbi:MAG TPA: hypothetical protein PKA34_25610 [Blastocatellia bacterium]|nr:hypothetical protein [Blastocatellia bacterium]HNG34774.1 hypothetical protein [Blastocatellia bacterium]
MSKVTPVRLMKGDNDKDTSLLSEMFDDASTYITSFAWCAGILESYFGLGVGGVVAVFLFKIRPAAKEIDDWLWVVVGDLPSAYLVTDNAPNPACALEAYIDEMEEWVKAAISGRSVDALIPVNVNPTLANAQSLKKRLNFLSSKILNYYTEDLNY